MALRHIYPAHHLKEQKPWYHFIATVQDCLLQNNKKPPENTKDPNNKNPKTMNQTKTPKKQEN